MKDSITSVAVATTAEGVINSTDLQLTGNAVVDTLIVPIVSGLLPLFFKWLATKFKRKDAR